jgi:hypothetical protein
MKQRPVAIGLFVCEQVIIEEQTRNVTLVNCFTKRVVKEVPSVPFPFVVFALLTDGIGEISLAGRIRRLDTLEVIFELTVAARFTDPLHGTRCQMRIRDCSFPVEGAYELALFADDEPIAHRRLIIRAEEES